MLLLNGKIYSLQNIYFVQGWKDYGQGYHQDADILLESSKGVPP